MHRLHNNRAVTDRAAPVRFYSSTYRMLSNRIGTFLNLPIDSLDKIKLQRRVREIGHALLERA